MSGVFSYGPMCGCAGPMAACRRMMGGRSKGEANLDARATAELRDVTPRLHAQVAISSGHQAAMQD